MCSSDLLALNSYENRVFQVGIDRDDQARSDSFVVVKFYRPHRWSDVQILEEHSFARELNEQPLALFSSGTGMGRDSVDIHTALVTLGYTHPYTRPLARGTTPSVEEVTSQVVAALASNPYRVDRTTDLRQVQQIVSREYVDVEPWPFAALIQD